MNGPGGDRSRDQVRLIEVGPRDGLQNEQQVLPVEKKVAFIDALSECGFGEIEVGSFVRPDAIPQLADTREVFERIRRKDGVVYSALVPNEKGLEAAKSAGVDKVSVFTAASDSFTRKNINCTVEESLDRFAPVIAGAMRSGLPVRAYVSCVVECPYEGSIDPNRVAEVTARLVDTGVEELVLGETLGTGSPDDIERLLAVVGEVRSPGELTLHLHDTHGAGVACARRGFELGVRSFDGSCGGLGGCPYAPGSAGNIATEDLLRLFDDLGAYSGVSIDSVLDVVRSIGSELGLSPRSGSSSGCGPKRPSS